MVFLIYFLGLRAEKFKDRKGIKDSEVREILGKSTVYRKFCKIRLNLNPFLSL